jgi:bifunctional non-homologous end joining protein LigD
MAHVNTKRVGEKTESQPITISPMLATLVKEPVSDPDYVYEVKWDGYRIIAHKNGSDVRLDSRGGENYTKKYPGIAKALAHVNHHLILDGEVVYINKDGKPDFDALQKIKGQNAPLVYYVFDILWLDDRNLMTLQLLERKEILREIIRDNKLIKYSDHFKDGHSLFKQVQALGLEGIVAKRKDSPYIPGDRSKRWLKMTTEQRQEFVIGGWVESEKRDTFRTLFFGAYENGKLKWIGHAGGGFKEKDMPKILARLKAIEIKENPFSEDVEYSEGKPHWVKPVLVANIKYATFTKAGKIRKPAIFLGFREDKKPNDVVTEIPVSLTKELQTENKKNTIPSESNWPILQHQKITSQENFSIEGCDMILHNVEKEIWKGITKADLIQYYNSVSDYILPHLRNRPLSLHIKHQGPNAPGLYIKDMEGHQPACADIFTTERIHKKGGKRNTIDYLVCNNKATLLYAVDLGCIDFNPWTSTTINPTEPDFIVIDLDPSDKNFKKAIEASKAAKEFFDQHKIKAFVKTSGKTGMHLLLPCSGFSFPMARSIAENICEEIKSMVPDITTTEITVANRGTKLYLDVNQNDYSDTVASAYSARPNKNPTVSTPLEWREINDRLDPLQFNITSISRRLNKKGDLFMGVLDKTVALKNNSRLKSFL